MLALNWLSLPAARLSRTNTLVAKLDPAGCSRERASTLESLSVGFAWAKSGRDRPRRHEAAVAAPHACGTALVRGDRSDRSAAGFVLVGKGLIDGRRSLTMAVGRYLRRAYQICLDGSVKG